MWVDTKHILLHNNSGRGRDPKNLDSSWHAYSFNIKFESCKQEIFRLKREHDSPHDWRVIKVTLSSSETVALDWEQNSNMIPTPVSPIWTPATTKSRSFNNTKYIISRLTRATIFPLSHTFLKLTNNITCVYNRRSLWQLKEFRRLWRHCMSISIVQSCQFVRNISF